MGVGSVRKYLSRHRLLVYFNNIFEVIHSLDPDLTRASFKFCSAGQHITQNNGVKLSFFRYCSTI